MDNTEPRSGLKKQEYEEELNHFTPETLPHKRTHNSKRLERLYLLGHQGHLCFPREKTKTGSSFSLLAYRTDLNDRLRFK